MRAQNMIERFFLPDWSVRLQQPIYATGGSSFNQLHHFVQLVRPPIRILQCREQKMYVLRHDNSSVKRIALAVIMQAMLKNQITSTRRKRLGVEFAEINKQCPPSFLNMRQTAAIIVRIGLEGEEIRGNSGTDGSFLRSLSQLTFQKLLEVLS